MLLELKSLRKRSVLARTDEIGHVDDLFFSDDSWVVRYLVVKTGWLTGRKILMAPEAVDRSDHVSEQLILGLDKEQAEKSPDIDVDRPVSAHRKEELHRYYGWSAPTALPGDPAMTSPVTPPTTPAVMQPPGTEEDRGDPHLRSAREIINYHIQATDGEIGHVEDLIIDDETWVVRYLIIDTRNWWPGKKVLVATPEARRISWEHRKVDLDLTRDEIRRSPEYDPSKPLSRDYEKNLHDYFGWPKYW